jgi:hypothetical protein
MGHSCVIVWREEGRKHAAEGAVPRGEADRDGQSIWRANQ